MKGISIFGKKIPVWILVASLVAAGAGAAAGTVMKGKVTGKAPATVKQALIVKSPTLTDADAGITTVSDDGTAFQAAAEVNNGDSYEINIPVQNKSDQSVVALLTLKHESPVQIGVSSAGNDASNVTRVGPDQWKFDLASNTNGSNDLIVRVALPDDAQPGYYTINGSIEAVNY